MIETIAAIYEEGVLRPLSPLLLPEHARVQIQIIAQMPAAQQERQRVRQALLDAGVIQPRPSTEPIPAISEAQAAAAANSLAAAGPLSELIVAERDGR